MADYMTETGLRLEGTFENFRNSNNSDLFKEVLREAHGVQDVIIAHHIVYVIEEKRTDGFAYQIVEEIPSADCLLFDHDIAKKIWGADYIAVLQRLVAEPCETRDELFAHLYRNRPEQGQ